MSASDVLAHQLAPAIRNALLPVPGVRSVSLVGSVTERADLAAVSDIDVVVLVDQLMQSVHQGCVAAVEDVTGAELGLPDYEVRVNDTFGPLKFDAPGVAVVHLMIYDLDGHRKHVLNSPFTCYDWERPDWHHGPSLRDVCPVIGLAPKDFLTARRGLENYLRDLAAGSISYRRTVFDDRGHPTEETAAHQLDARHQAEYGYHVMKNLAVNWWKLWHRVNRVPEWSELEDFWHAQPGLEGGCWPTLAALHRAKRAGGEIPDGAAEVTVRMLHHFMDWLQQTLDQAPRLELVRHGRTALNDGTFLGQRRDPGLVDPVPASGTAWDVVWSSPLRRAGETARGLAPDGSPRTDPRLQEIDYGEVEGLAISALASNYPDLLTAWQRGEDPPFPGGENSRDVWRRLQDFLGDASREPFSRALAVSHNVVLRCAVGGLLGLPTSEWFRLPMAHLELVELIRLQDRWFLQPTSEQRIRWTDSLTQWSPTA